MKKMIALVALVLVASLFASCVVTTPLCATSNPIGAKVGVATVTFVMGFAIDNGGNMGIQKAAEKGGIKKISTVDQKVEIVIPQLVTKVSTIVTGD